MLTGRVISWIFHCDVEAGESTVIEVEMRLKMKNECYLARVSSKRTNACSKCSNLIFLARSNSE
jgi:hypothetical protein